MPDAQGNPTREELSQMLQGLGQAQGSVAPSAEMNPQLTQQAQQRAAALKLLQELGIGDPSQPVPLSPQAIEARKNFAAYAASGGDQTKLAPAPATINRKITQDIPSKPLPSGPLAAPVVAPPNPPLGSPSNPVVAGLPTSRYANDLPVPPAEPLPPTSPTPGAKPSSGISMEQGKTFEAVRTELAQKLQSDPPTVDDIKKGSKDEGKSKLLALATLFGIGALAGGGKTAGEMALHGMGLMGAGFKVHDDRLMAEREQGRKEEETTTNRFEAKTRAAKTKAEQELGLDQAATAQFGADTTRKKAEAEVKLSSEKNKIIAEANVFRARAANARTAEDFVIQDALKGARADLDYINKTAEEKAAMEKAAVESALEAHRAGKGTTGGSKAPVEGATARKYAGTDSKFVGKSFWYKDGKVIGEVK